MPYTFWMRSRLSRALSLLSIALLTVTGILFSTAHPRLASIFLIAGIAVMWIGPLYDRIDDWRLGNLGELPLDGGAPGDQ